jgi:hypothetical protein
MPALMAGGRPYEIPASSRSTSVLMTTTHRQSACCCSWSWPPGPIDVSGLNVIKGRAGVFLIPNEGPLDLTGRIVSSGGN